MVPFLTTTLVVSTLGMIALLGIKRYELATGRVLAASVRPGLRAFFRRGLFWLERVLPSLAAHELRRGWSVVRAALRAGMARVLLAAERELERGLVALRRVTAQAPQAPGEASAFLREVAEHKKKLIEKREE